MRNLPRFGLAALLLVAAARPAVAQVDLSGMWQTLPRNQDGSGMTGDTAGVPVSPNGRWRGDSWSPDDFDVAEWVCRPHSFHYGLEGGLSRMRVWSEVDMPTQKVIAWHAHANQEEQEITIWMDGRPHPPENALHTEATETALERGRAPHFLPGHSPLPGLNPKLTDRFGTPPEARLGGPATMYPEYIARMKTMSVPKEVGAPRD